MGDQKALVPRLRFPEFWDAGDWDFRELEDACEVNPSNSTLPELFVYIDLEAVEAGQLIKKKKISREGAPSRAQRVLRSGDVIFQIVRPYQQNNFFCDFVDGEKYVASTGYAQLRAFESKEFLYQVVHAQNFVARVLSKCTGSNYPAIKSSDLAKIQVAVPVQEEQQKIADCLSSLDALIAAQGEKIDALKTHKKGLMQQLFPREGETVPRPRFPEFREAGEWKQLPLGGIVGFMSGGTPSKDRIDYWGGDIPWVSAASMHEISIDRSDRSITQRAVDDGARTIPKGTLLILVRGSMLHKRIPIGITACRVAFNQDVKALRMKSEISEEFLLHLLISNEGRLLCAVSGTGIGAGKLDTSELEAFFICIPEMKEEQQRIAICLSSLDNLIATHTAKLDVLKSHKNGLMQQLFPSLEKAAP